MVEEKVESYSGVLCRCCRQPIALPAMVARNQGEEAAPVFSLRCKACDKERPYRQEEVLSFAGVPRHREAHAGLAQWQRNRMARAASA